MQYRQAKGHEQARGKVWAFTRCDFWRPTHVIHSATVDEYPALSPMGRVQTTMEAVGFIRSPHRRRGRTPHCEGRC